MVTDRTSSLTAGTNAGLMLAAAGPSRTAAGDRAAGRPSRRTASPACPCLTHGRSPGVSTRNTAGWNGSHRWATCGLSRSAAIRYWIRSFDPMLTKSTSSRMWSMHTAAAGTSIMTPNGTSSPYGDLLPVQRHPGPVDQPAELAHLLDGADHREQDADRPVAAGRPAGWPAAGSGRTPGARNVSRMLRQPMNGLASR